MLCPDASLWWTLPGWEAERVPSSQEVWRLDFCRFGTLWRKRTCVATNTVLRGARLLCCNKDHVRLFGFSKVHQKPWTSVADSRPRGFSRAIAVALASRAGWCAERPLDPLACAKLVNCCRAGEAANPGPRAPRARDASVDLETRPLYSETSSFLGLRAWTSFLSWCARTLSFDPLPVFHSCPPLLAMALRSFGNYLYRSGGSLQTYRYAIVAGQRINWCMKGQLGPAWELVSRWEKLQPIRRRTPIPEELGGSGLVQGLQTMGCLHSGGLLWFGSHRRSPASYEGPPAAPGRPLLHARGCFSSAREPKVSCKGRAQGATLEGRRAADRAAPRQSLFKPRGRRQVVPFWTCRVPCSLELSFGALWAQESARADTRWASWRWSSLGLPPWLCRVGHTMAYATSSSTYVELLSARSGSHQFGIGCR